MRLAWRIITAGTLAALAITATSPGAQARSKKSPDSDALQLAEISGATIEEARKFIAEQGAILDEAHKKLEAEALTPRPGEGVVEAPVLRSGGDDGGSVKLPLGNAGDVVYYDRSKFGINHGHSAIYMGKKRIVEAANENLGVRKILAEERSVPKGHTWIAWVDASTDPVVRQTKWSQAATWAKGKIDQPYNWRVTVSGLNSVNWLDNKYYVKPWNCSQLVWASYKRLGVETDVNGGKGVWPVDILNHNKVKAYKKL